MRRLDPGESQKQARQMRRGQIQLVITIAAIRLRRADFTGAQRSAAIVPAASAQPQ